MCETCRKSLKRSIYIQKMKTPQRKRRRYVNNEHVSRRVRFSEQAINARIGREISPAQVVFVDEMRNPITFKSHIHLSISAVSTCLFNFSEVQIPFDECSYTGVSFFFSGKCFPVIFVFGYDFVDIIITVQYINYVLYATIIIGVLPKSVININLISLLLISIRVMQFYQQWKLIQNYTLHVFKCPL